MVLVVSFMLLQVSEHLQAVYTCITERAATVSIENRKTLVL